jgi:hypothetical protein
MVIGRRSGGAANAPVEGGTFEKKIDNFLPGWRKLGIVFQKGLQVAAVAMDGEPRVSRPIVQGMTLNAQEVGSETAVSHGPHAGSRAKVRRLEASSSAR